MNPEKTLDISWATIFKIGTATLLFYILYLIKDIIILIIFSLVISTLLNPAVEFLQKFRIKRVLAVSLVFIFMFGFLGFSIYWISLAFVSEIKSITILLNNYSDKLVVPFKALGLEIFQNTESFVSSLESWLNNASKSIISAISVFFGGIFTSISIFFLSFFFSLEEKWVEKTIHLIFPKRYEVLAQDIWIKSQRKISLWFSIRILTSIFVALATFITLKIFKVDYSISLSFFVGITNIIPYLGPLLAGSVIGFLILFEDWLKAVFVVIVFILIQQLEGSILSPILMNKFIGLSPVLVLISLIIGIRIFGPLGVILSIPLTGILFDFLKEFLKKRKEEQISEN